MLSMQLCKIHCRCQNSELDVLRKYSLELADYNFLVADNNFEVDNSLVELEVVDRNFVALLSLELGIEIDRIGFEVLELLAVAHRLELLSFDS